MKELYRISKRNAILILTTQGSHAQSGLPPEDKDILKEKGFLYKVTATRNFKAAGSPDFYELAWHTKQYVIDTWSTFFSIRSYIERGLPIYIGHIGRGTTLYQDLILLEKIGSE
ncbi:MAG: hypothetical protein ACETVZ_09430 [Phycisphaerae bacterium]